MSKNAKKLKNFNLKLISFYTIISLFTVAFIAILVLLFIESRPFEDYDDIKEANLTLAGEELFTNKKANDYFVYIYTTDMDNNKVDTFKAEELKPIIFNYFNFVKLNSRKDGIIPIYGFDVSISYNRTVVSNSNSNNEIGGFDNFKVNETDLPMLVRISNGTVSTRTITSNDIQKSIQTATDNFNNVRFEAIISRREDILVF
ncbi:MAG: hypothetical protein WC008_01845 [Bacilli bacterium]